MGGFTINGCGAADSFYMLRTLPGHLCSSCGKTDYAVMEVKRKVRVFYIPTVSINTKYAVACPKCKNGYYISDEQKEYILQNGPSCVEVTGSGVRLLSDNGRRVVDADSFDVTVPDGDEVGCLCQCGAKLAPNAKFCTKCGRKVDADNGVGVLPPEIEKEVIIIKPEIEINKDEPKPYVPRDRGKVCPGCGIRLMNAKEICGICGTKLE